MIMKKDKKELIVMGDRVMLSPIEGEDRTAIGLYLPQTLSDKESVQTGLVIAVGPGLPLPGPQEMEDEPWKTGRKETAHVPMQVRIGDHAIFLKKTAVEIKFEGKTYLVIPQAAILVLLRDQAISF
jgi:chaperonin GroES